MKRTLYDSEIFALEARGGVLPYRIMVDETRENGIRSIAIHRIEYLPIDGKLVEHDQVLTTSMWEEEYFLDDELVVS